MSNRLFSRRDFSRAISGSLALAFTPPPWCAPLDAKSWEPPAGAPIRLNYNESPYGPSPMALKALGVSGLIAARYPEDSRDQMMAALADFHRVRPENILLGCGSTEILRAADMAFLQPGQNIVAAEPTFEAVLSYAGVAHAKAVKLPLTSDHRHDLPRMAAACTSKTGVVYVCNPNNPTGTIVRRRELEEFISRISPTTLLLVDEAYFHFVKDPAYASVADWFPQHPNVLAVRTFSKVYGLAGMRLGYAVGAKETIAALRTQLIEDNVNAAVIPAALTALGDSSYVTTCCDRLNSTRHWLAEQLARSGRSYIPSEANFLMIDVGKDVKSLIPQFAARGIMVGRRFATLNNFLRVSIGTQQEMGSFWTVFNEIAPPQTRGAA
jgi:histidinol-phosphate aminotransferase